MKRVNVSSVCLNQTPLDWDKNRENILGAISKSREDEANIVLFPELSISGCDKEGLFFAESSFFYSLDSLKKILPYTKDLLVALGMPLKLRNRVFSVSVIVKDKKVIGIVPKQFFYLKSVFSESSFFESFKKGEYEFIDILDFKNVLFGSLLFDFNGIRIGFEIGEDALLKEKRPALDLVKKGANLILNLGRSPFSFLKLEKRKASILEAVKGTKVSYVFSNLLGNESGSDIFDGGSIFCYDEEIKHIGKRFSFESFVVTTLTLKLDNSTTSKVLKNGKNREPYIVKENFSLNSKKIILESSLKKRDSFESSSFLKKEEFIRAISLGLFDYLRKSKSNGFTISFSGGADSSTISILVHLMIELGVLELGIDGFKEKLSYIQKLKDCSSVFDITKKLLILVYQGTKNSSPETFNSSKSLSNVIGADFYSVDIDSLYKEYISLVKNALNEEITWEKNDLALQNIQARTRAPLIWLVSNLKNHLLLSTSNRSEATVGYCTMDGDTAGGINPIADVDKVFIRDFLKWMELEKDKSVKSIKSLNLVNSIQPTAELRPREYNQKDEDDLMPYKVLKTLELLAIKDKMSVKEVFFELSKKYKNQEPEIIYKWVYSFFTLWAKNQWKKKRFAPAFNVAGDDLSLANTINFPILSSGFKKELMELKKNINI